MSVPREFTTSLPLVSTETYSCRLWQSILIRLYNEKKKELYIIRKVEYLDNISQGLLANFTRLNNITLK